MSNLPQEDLEFIAKLEHFALRATKAIGSIWSLIIHTVLFIAAFSLTLFGISFQLVLLVVTTILSLEAIYLSIFIQMSVNHTTKALATVEKEIDELSEDVEDIAEDVGEIQEDVEGIEENMEEIQSDIDEIQKDVDEIQEDVEDIAEDMDIPQDEDKK